jgi:hypothetical protein
MPKLLETFDQLKMSSEIRSTDPLSFTLLAVFVNSAFIRFISTFILITLTQYYIIVISLTVDTFFPVPVKQTRTKKTQFFCRIFFFFFF